MDCPSHIQPEDSMSTKSKRQEAVAFFHEHAGWSYDPKRETPEQGRLKCATSLAKAEEWLARKLLAGKAVVEWHDDPDGALSAGDSTGPWFSCMVRVGKRVEWLGGVDFAPGEGPGSSPYARVVVAELALELMP